MSQSATLPEPVFAHKPFPDLPRGVLTAIIEGLKSDSSGKDIYLHMLELLDITPELRTFLITYLSHEARSSSTRGGELLQLETSNAGCVSDDVLQLIGDWNFGLNYPPYSAVHWAVQTNNQMIVQQVLKRFKDGEWNLHILPFCGMTPLHFAALMGVRSEIVKMLLETREFLYCKDDDGRTAFDMAEDHGATTVVAMIGNFK